MKLEFPRHNFEKYSNAKFHENPSSGISVVPCAQKNGLTYILTDVQTDITELIFAYRILANVPKMTNTCIVIRVFTTIVNFILPVELIMNIEVTAVYFSTLYSHLEGQTEEGHCVSPVGNPTGIRGDYPLNVS